jgi:hypothetical protein
MNSVPWSVAFADRPRFEIRDLSCFLDAVTARQEIRRATLARIWRLHCRLPGLVGEN